MPEAVQLPALDVNAAAEFDVLGFLINNPAHWDDLGYQLAADDFCVAGNAQIFRALQSLADAGQAVDSFLVWDELQRLNIVDGLTIGRIFEITNACLIGLASAERRCRMLKDASTTRALQYAGVEILDVTQDAEKTVEQRIDIANAALEKATRTAVAADPQPIAAYAANMLDRVQDLADGKVEPGLPTRIPRLDRLLAGGLKGGKQVVLAARPSVGKSSLAQQICLTLALDGHATAFFSMEMSNQELTDRATANLGRISLDGFSTGKLQDEEWSRLAEAVERMRNLPMYFHEQPGMTLSEIASRARTLKRKHNLRVLAVDYLQLCASGKKADNRHHQIEEISRGLKTLAKQLDITILSLSQLNRSVESRSSPEPTLSDLKESGAIEEDADTVLMLWTDYRNDDMGVRRVGCSVPKNRQGQTGRFALHFEGAHQRWTESTEELKAGQGKARNTGYSQEI